MRTEVITFDVVDFVYPYNAIFGRNTINKFNGHSPRVPADEDTNRCGGDFGVRQPRGGSACRAEHFGA
jgi:hypothetical protein